MPKAKIFRYKKYIDTKIKVAVSEALKMAVIDAEPIRQGEYNYVYKVKTPKGFVLARVFRRNDWPEDGKLQWIEKQLKGRHLPFAKILYFSRSAKYFPCGFMVSEFIKGCDGRKAVDIKQISLSEAFFFIGKTLKEIHKIKIKNFGLINKGKGTEADFIKLRTRLALKQLASLKNIDKDLTEKIKKVVKGKLEPFRGRLQPVLVHADPARENAIYTPDGKWVLVDWDNATSSTWVEDYADLTFWADYHLTSKIADKRKRLIRDNFFKGYGKTDFRPAEIEGIELVLHIMMCVQKLPYYYFTQKNMPDFKYIKNKLARLLREALKK